MKTCVRIIPFAFFVLFMWCSITLDSSARPPKRDRGKAEVIPNRVSDSRLFSYGPEIQLDFEDSLYVFQNGQLIGNTLDSLRPDSILCADIRFEFVETGEETHRVVIFEITTPADTAGKPQWRYLPLPPDETYNVILLDGQESMRSIVESYSPDLLRSMQYFPEDSLLFVCSRLRDGVRVTSHGDSDDSAYHYYIHGKGGSISGRESEPDWFFKGLQALNHEPTFRGGDLTAFRVWVQRQLKYPMDAILAEIPGHVIFSFMIDKTGSLTNIDIIERMGTESMVAEVYRVLSLSPLWEPGYHWGVPVQFRYINLPVMFGIFLSKEF